MIRSINITQDIEEVLRQLVVAIPDVFLEYDVNLIELQVDEKYCEQGSQAAIPTVWEIVFVESDETELVIGEVTLLENFDAIVEIFAD